MMAPGLGLLHCPEELQKACQIAFLHQADLANAGLTWQATLEAALVGRQKTAFQAFANLAGGQRVKGKVLVPAVEQLEAIAGTDGGLVEALTDAEMLAALATALLAAGDVQADVLQQAAVVLCTQEHQQHLHCQAATVVFDVEVQDSQQHAALELSIVVAVTHAGQVLPEQHVTTTLRQKTAGVQAELQMDQLALS